MPMIISAVAGTIEVSSEKQITVRPVCYVCNESEAAVEKLSFADVLKSTRSDDDFGREVWEFDPDFAECGEDGEIYHDSAESGEDDVAQGDSNDASSVDDETRTRVTFVQGLESRSLRRLKRALYAPARTFLRLVCSGLPCTICCIKSCRRSFHYYPWSL